MKVSSLELIHVGRHALGSDAQWTKVFSLVLWNILVAAVRVRSNSFEMCKRSWPWRHRKKLMIAASGRWGFQSRTSPSLSSKRLNLHRELRQLSWIPVVASISSAEKGLMRAKPPGRKGVALIISTRRSSNHWVSTVASAASSVDAAPPVETSFCSSPSTAATSGVTVAIVRRELSDAVHHRPKSLWDTEKLRQHRKSTNTKKQTVLIYGWLSH